VSRQHARWREKAGGSHDESPLETAFTLVAVILGAVFLGLLVGALSLWVKTGRWLP